MHHVIPKRWLRKIRELKNSANSLSDQSGVCGCLPEPLQKIDSLDDKQKRKTEEICRECHDAWETKINSLERERGGPLTPEEYSAICEQDLIIVMAA